jgi:uncharacterized protein YjgD (DUF1641 family)
MSKPQINRFSIANSYKKEQAMELLKKLTLEQIKTIVDFNNKEVLLNIINNKFTKKELQEMLYKSNITDETLYKVLHEKTLKKMIAKVHPEEVNIGAEKSE